MKTGGINFLLAGKYIKFYLQKIIMTDEQINI